MERLNFLPRPDQFVGHLPQLLRFGPQSRQFMHLRLPGRRAAAGIVRVLRSVRQLLLQRCDLRHLLLQRLILMAQCLDRLMLHHRKHGQRGYSNAACDCEFVPAHDL